MRLIVRLLLAALLLFSAAQVFAQATATGTIRGTVTDPSNAVISGAQVTITNTGTNLTRSATSGATGGYVFDQLPPGSYSVKVTKAGFSAGVSKIELLVGQTATTNFALKPGSVEQVVEVTSAAPIIDVEKTSVSQEVTPSEVEQLPLLGRDAANLAYLAPGVKQADSFDPTKNRSAVLSVNGSVGRDVNVTVNGVDNKDSTVGGTVMQLPLEAVEEFVISTQRFSAANGRSEGAAINMITKSGTNQYHGSLFGYFREQQFNADLKNPSSIVNGKQTFDYTNPPYSRQFFGGSIGGPVLKDKIFGFFAYERQRENTALAETGNAYNELSLLPAYFGATVVKSVPTPFYENRYNGRMDFKINNKNTAYVSASIQANNGNNDQEDGFGDLSVGNFTVNHMQVANMTLNSVLSPTLVNSFTFGYQYWNNVITTDNPGAPLITFPSSEWVGQSQNVSQQSYQRKWQWKDDMTLTRGKHTFKYGVDYIWNPTLGGYFNANSTLEIDYASDPSAIIAAGGFNQPGLVSSMSISTGDPKNDVPGGTKQLGFYFQDDWKVTKRLTLNLGLRYDKDMNLIGGSAMKTSKTFLELEAINSPYGKMPHDDNKDFSPRIGFAYDLTGAGKHVLRGGFGLYYGNVYQNIPLWMEQQANPNVYQQSLSAGDPGDPVPGLVVTDPSLGGPCGGTNQPTCTLSQFIFSPANVEAITTANKQTSPLIANGGTGRTMDPKYRNPYNEEFNIGYQWAINPSSVFEAEYTHTLTLHSNVDVNINPKDPVTGVRPLSADFTALGCPAGYCVLGRTMDNQSIGRSRYDGVNLSYRQRMYKHFSLIANYTLSRAQGYAISSGGPANLSVTSAQSSYHSYPHDPLAPLAKWDFGPTPFDERHHITISGIVSLPWGFQAAPILQFGSARPYDINSGYDVLNLGTGYSRPVIIPNDASTAYSTFATSNPLYANVSATNTYKGQTSPAAAASLDARTCLSSGACHIVPYDTLRGAPYFELDARISKNIKFGEKANLQLSFQGFNLTNRANYGNNFNYVIGSSSFGKPAGFVNPTSTSTAKAFVGEFGARFTF